MEKKNVLYMLEMGMNDNNIPTDIKNHRIRTIENIDIIFERTPYNMFFEFCFWERYRYRTENKRTGAPLKKPVREIVNPVGLTIDTQFERDEYDEIRGYKYKSSWRLSSLERKIYDSKMNYCYTRADILKIINRFSIDHFDELVLIEERATEIINAVGGIREKTILKNDSYFQISDTWNDEHKIVKCIERVNYKPGASCEVDLITGKITN